MTPAPKRVSKYAEKRARLDKLGYGVVDTVPIPQGGQESYSETDETASDNVPVAVPAADDPWAVNW
jgi:hypothetical protein